MSYVFYDVETTGLSPQFDQIVSFAAIRTDADLNETARLDVHCRLLPYVIPSPEALLVNGQEFTSLLSSDRQSHYEMMRVIAQTMLAWSPSIFVGHNSLNFDERMLHHAFYQTLQSPYLTSLNGNGRGDSMSLVMATDTIEPSALARALGTGGRSSYRLRDIAIANGLLQRQAHDAMSDVETTLALCRLVRLRCRDAWSRWNRFARKGAVIDFLTNEDAFVLTEFFSNRAYHAPVTCIGPVAPRSNDYLCLNLAADIDVLRSASMADLSTILRTRPSPVRRIKANASPVLTPLFEVNPESVGDFDEAALVERANEVREDSGFSQRLIAAWASSQPSYIDGGCAEAQLYGSFIERSEEPWMQQFHEVPWGERQAVASRFTDSRLRCFALRLIYGHDPNLLTAEAVAEVHMHLRQRFSPENGALDRDAAASRARELTQTDPSANAAMQRYLVQLAALSA